MRRIALVAVLIFLLLSTFSWGGCPSNTPVKTKSNTTVVNKADSTDPVIDDTQKRIKEIEESVEDLDARVEEMKGQVLNIDDDTVVHDSNYKVVVEVTSTEIRVNGEKVSRSEFRAYVEKHRVCDEAPLLVASPKADQKQITWVLEQLYSAGCDKVVIEETP